MHLSIENEFVTKAGGVGRIDYVGSGVALEIKRQPAPVVASIGQDITFSVLATGESPLGFQWFRNGQLITGENGSQLTIRNVQALDNDAEFFVQVTDGNDAMVVSDIARLLVNDNSSPIATITQPDTDLLYVAGQEYAFAGTATDSEDGDLDATAFDWEIVFHHNTHTHEFIPQLPGVTAGSFVPSVINETDADVWYRVHLTVTDSAGTTSTVYQDVFPLTSTVTLETNPEGLEVLLGGAPSESPTEFLGVAGVTRSIQAPETQVINGQTYVFDSWFNGGERNQTLSTPLFDTTYVATYELQPKLPLIREQPASSTTVVGGQTSFKVVVTGEAPFTYQWFRNNTILTPETSSSLSLSGIKASDDGAEFHVIITDRNGNSVTSDSATLTVSDNGDATEIDRITLDNENLAGNRWKRIPFEPLSSGTHTIRYSSDSDAEIYLSVFSILNTQGESERIGTTYNTATPDKWTGTLDSSLQYYLVIWAKTGSANVVITIEAASGNVTPLEIITQPSDLSVSEEEDATLSVTATGSGTLNYQWFAGASEIAGAISNILTIGSAGVTDSGTRYSVVVTDINGSITSRTATLTVTESNPTPPNVTNIGQGTLDADKNAGRRFVRLNFESQTTSVHTINLAWDSNADLRFNVFEANGNRINSTTVQGVNPGIWTGELDANKKYYLAVWSSSGIANYSVTMQTTGSIMVQTQPGDQYVNEGEDAVFTVVANGNGTLRYQWFADTSAIVGAADSTLVISPATIANSGFDIFQ